MSRNVYQTGTSPHQTGAEPREFDENQLKCVQISYIFVYSFASQNALLLYI